MRRVFAFCSALLLFAAVPISTAAEAPSVSSVSAVLLEPQSGRVLFEKNADEKRPMASTTKLMTALVAAERLPPTLTVTVPASAVAVEGSAVGLRGGDTLTVYDLMAGLLLSSGNDAANALAMLCDGSLSAFAARMNRKAAELGMARTLFVTPSGLDEGGHASTARDMALLGAAALKQPLVATLCATKQATLSVNGVPVTVTNHNRLLWLYEDAIGMKTGFTKKSGKCLVSAAKRDGVTLVAATLNGGDYWNDHISLFEYGFSQTASVPLEVPALPTVTVCGGTASSVEVLAEAPKPVVLLKEEKALLKAECQLPTFVWAPVEAGETVGVLRYTVGDRTVAEVPLTIKETIAARKATPFMKKWQRQWRRLWLAVTE